MISTTLMKRYDKDGNLIYSCITDSNGDSHEYIRKITKDDKNRIISTEENSDSGTNITEYEYAGEELLKADKLNQLKEDTVVSTKSNGKFINRIFIEDTIKDMEEDYLYSVEEYEYDDINGDLVRKTLYERYIAENSEDDNSNIKATYKDKIYITNKEVVDMYLKTVTYGIYKNGKETTKSVSVFVNDDIIETVYEDHSDDKCDVFTYKTKNNKDELVNDGTYVYDRKVKTTISTDNQYTSEKVQTKLITKKVNSNGELEEKIEIDGKLVKESLYKIDGEDLYELYSKSTLEGFEEIVENEYNENNKLITHSEKTISDGSEYKSETSHIYNENGLEYMITINDTVNGNSISKHVIKEYDSLGRCIHEISEASEVRIVYQDNKEVFRCTYNYQPNQKEIFDFYFNKVITFISERD